MVFNCKSLSRGGQKTKPKTLKLMTTSETPTVDKIFFIDTSKTKMPKSYHTKGHN
jgi:hypothetical protein